MRILTLFCLVASPALLSADGSGLLEASQRNLIYGMDHGAALLMDVYKPEASNGHALLFIMGTGFTAYGEYDDIPLKELDAFLLRNRIFSDFFGETGQIFLPAVSAGFTVFSINHRLGPKNQFETQLRDCQRAVQYVRAHAEQFGIDPDWIAGMGHSSGAAMIAHLAFSEDISEPEASDPVARQSSRLQAAVIVAGMHDLLGQIQQRPSSGAILLSLTGQALTYQPPGHPVYRRYQDSSSLSRVSSDDPPVFLIHGTADDVVDQAQSLALAKALDTASVPFTSLWLEGANHAELGKSYHPLPMKQAADWLSATLAH